MRYIQTELKELSKIFDENIRIKNIADNCCCAIVALWIMGLDVENLPEMTKIIASEIGKGLYDDCTVVWADFFENVSGRKIKVERLKINSLSELKKYKGKIAVKYTKENNSHWVGVEGGKIKCNSLEHSNCVENGNPTEARIITFA